MIGGKRRHGIAATSLGYTIIEVMIVLAVSGVMFIIAGNFISGKQGKTAFVEGVNEFASTMQDTIEGVTDGQYTDINVNCQFLGSNVTFPPGGATQGTNSDCVFVGKVLHFNEAIIGNTTPNQQYEVFSVAAGRVGSNSKPITDLALAAPTVIPGLTSQQVIPQRLDVNSIKVNGGGVASSSGVGFIQGLGTTDTVTGDVENGAQTVSLYYVAGITPTPPMQTAPASAAVNGSNLHQAKSIDICLTDQTRWALVTLGTNNNQLSVNVDMRGGNPC